MSRRPSLPSPPGMQYPPSAHIDRLSALVSRLTTEWDALVEGGQEGLAMAKALTLTRARAALNTARAASDASSADVELGAPHHAANGGGNCGANGNRSSGGAPGSARANVYGNGPHRQASTLCGRQRGPVSRDPCSSLR